MLDFDLTPYVAILGVVMLLFFVWPWVRAWRTKRRETKIRRIP